MTRAALWTAYLLASAFLIALFGNWAVDVLEGKDLEAHLIGGVSMLCLAGSLALAARRLP